MKNLIIFGFIALSLLQFCKGSDTIGSLEGISLPSVGGSPNIPLPINPLSVTASSFELLTDKIGYKMSITYACGVVMAMNVYLNTTLPIPTPPTIIPIPGADTGSAVVGGILPTNTKQLGTIIVDEAKYLNPIVLVGSTCLSSISGLPTPPIQCANYNVFKNSMSFD